MIKILAVFLLTVTIFGGCKQGIMESCLEDSDCSSDLLCCVGKCEVTIRGRCISDMMKEFKERDRKEALKNPPPDLAPSILVPLEEKPKER